ncbi:MerR family transcriptional regulator [Streptomyces xiamenensis]|uniref:MerR family transcriptional regulator n=1 Tax=Streptomyces xiamenensis TaxID=408015 RepID=UPI0034177D40
MLIGELSRRTGVPARLLRYYEQRGLLTSRRDTNNYRQYAEDTPRTVVRIREMLDAGLPTEAIREVLPCTDGADSGADPCPEVLRTLAQELERLETTLATLHDRHTALTAFRTASLDRATAHGAGRPSTG